MVKQHSQLMLALLGLADLAVTAGAALLAWRIAGATGRGGQGVLALSLVLAPFLFGRCGLYRPRRTGGIVWEWADIVRACLIVCLLDALLLSVLLEGSAVHLVAVFAGVWIGLMLVYRTLGRLALRLLRRRGWNLRWACIVGDGPAGGQLADELQANPWTGIRLLYRLADAPDGSVVPVAGTIDQLAECFDAQPVEMVFVALSAQQQERMAGVLEALGNVTTDVRIVPDLVSYSFLRRQVSQIGSLPVISLTHSPQEGWNALLKRAFDFAGAIALLGVLGPLMLLIALLIRLRDGRGVLFVQTRASLGGKSFAMLKFRTMRVGSGDEPTRPEDPRVTSLGRFLRRSSLDELPQLFNVLIGQMSLVGPRPERPERIDLLRRQIPHYLLRQHVKAGMTGWAQIHGLRGQCDLSRRIQYDIYYIIHWSFGLDLWILLRTLGKGFFHPNAY